MAGDDGELTERTEDVPVPREDAKVDDRIEAIRESIESSRERIDASLRDVRSEVDEALDWRGWVEDNPYKAVGTAFFAGFYLGFR